MPTDITPISYIRIGEVDHPIDAVTVGGKLLKIYQMLFQHHQMKMKKKS